jgi:hypothetical protein
MKKNQKSTQKLKLSRETLRQLDRSQLEAVAGGTVWTCIYPPECVTGQEPGPDPTDP